jgi:OTU-like cysteine protease
MPQPSIKTNAPIVFPLVKKYSLVEVLDKQNSFFWAVLLALLTQPKLYSSVPFDLFDQDPVFQDRAFEEICEKCFSQTSILERQKIKKLIEQFAKNGDLTFIVRNPIFQQAISFLRKKSEDYFKSHATLFSNLFPKHYNQFLSSISIRGRFPNESDIKALAIGLNYEIVVTSSATQRLVRYSVSPLALTAQKPLSEMKVCPIYLEDQAQKGYAFGTVNQSILKESIDRYQRSLVTYPRYLLNTSFIHVSWRLWQVNHKIYTGLRILAQISSFGPLVLAYWQQKNKRLSLPVPSLRNFLLRLFWIEEHINSFLLENKRMNIKESKAGILFQKMIDHFSELDGYYSAVMMWVALGGILIPCLPAIRIFFLEKKELAALSFLNFQKQPPDQYNWQYQEFLIRKSNFDLALEWLIPSKTPFRQAFLVGSFIDISNYAVKIKQLYPLIIFGLFFAFFGANPDMAQDPSFINMELIMQMFYLMFLGVPYLMHGIETTGAATYLLFQKTNQATAQIMSKATEKVRQATLGCFFKAADESENDEIFLGERAADYFINPIDESDNDEIFLGNTIVGRLFNKADELENDKIFLEDTRRATTSSQNEANVSANHC